MIGYASSEISSNLLHTTTETAKSNFSKRIALERIGRSQTKSFTGKKSTYRLRHLRGGGYLMEVSRQTLKPRFDTPMNLMGLPRTDEPNPSISLIGVRITPLAQPNLAPSLLSQQSF